ncbi:Relaxin receptor 1 [Portunus trituberculatus]|uniref:Relaxin receptor 1 n=1 Tax=Portunus trituberculatus TaxID=210409 RepID=A0A5B7K9M3_PORTR|nr:Relaxin receptor 1 [Portunus trituberculatus]
MVATTTTTVNITTKQQRKTTTTLLSILLILLPPLQPSPPPPPPPQLHIFTTHIYIHTSLISLPNPFYHPPPPLTLSPHLTLPFLTTVADLLTGLYLLVIAVKDREFRARYSDHAYYWMTSWQCTITGVLAMTSSEVRPLWCWWCIKWCRF